MSFLKLWYNFQYALNGILLNLRENTFKIMVLCAIVVIILSFILKISYYEWLIVLICIGLNLALEGINTVWETTFDYLETKYSLPVQNIKDLIASTVLIVAIITAIIGIVIFLPKIITLLRF